MSHRRHKRVYSSYRHFPGDEQADVCNDLGCGGFARRPSQRWPFGLRWDEGWGRSLRLGDCLAGKQKGGSRKIGGERFAAVVFLQDVIFPVQ
jgi:hypothetical protein